MKIYRIAQAKSTGYKVMLWDASTKEAVSWAEPSIRWKPVVGKTYSMGGNGIYLANSKESALTFGRNGIDQKEPYSLILLCFEFDIRDIVTGGTEDDGESECSVKRARLASMETV